MKLGIIIEKSGTFLFKLPENNIVITQSYIQKNMLGWLFHAPNTYDYISFLPIEKFIVSCGDGNIDARLIEITEEKAQEFYSALVTPQEENTMKKINR